MVRRKERYFVCEVIYPNKSSTAQSSFISRDAILQALKESIKDCHGILGLATLEPERGVVRIKHVNPTTSFVLFRCLRDHHRLFWSALTFIREIDGKDCFFNTLYVGATLRSCESFILKHHKRKLTEMLSQTRDLKERTEIQKLIIEACSS